jgi:hypothetical protein
MQTNLSELRRKTCSYPLRFEKKVRLSGQLVAGDLAGKLAWYFVTLRIC